jgi:16S rRNA (guanine527-N7)-methyltransferase
MPQRSRAGSSTPPTGRDRGSAGKRDAALQHSPAQTAQTAQTARPAKTVKTVKTAQTAKTARLLPESAAASPARGQADAETALAQALAALNLPLEPEIRRRLLDYLGLLAKWNAVYNLTAIRDPHQMLVAHLFDCLAIVAPLRERALLEAGTTVLDVGSGAGLPGALLAMLAPEVEVHCVDAVGKKAAFVAQLRAELGLANLHAHHARVERLQAPRDLAPAALIVSRAFASLAQFVECSAHLLAPGGSWAAMKGQMPDDEIAALPAAIELSAAIKLEVPGLEAQRHLLLLRARG